MRDSTCPIHPCPHREGERGVVTSRVYGILRISICYNRRIVPLRDTFGESMDPSGPLARYHLKDGHIVHADKLLPQAA